MRSFMRACKDQTKNVQQVCNGFRNHLKEEVVKTDAADFRFENLVN